MAVPFGIILLWSGAVADMPHGFQLCDGTNGTPDLRNRFVVGAGDTYDPDDTGGVATHTHTFTTDGHWHRLPTAFSIEGGDGLDRDTDVKTDTGTTDPGNNLPPYYALCYIQKV